MMNQRRSVESQSEAKIHEKGLTKLEGKEYEIQEGDGVHSQFSV
jgi:ribosome-binding ATPase YchF (GTP1/OBG family)